MANLLGLEVKTIVETTPEEIERVKNWINISANRLLQYRML